MSQEPPTSPQPGRDGPTIVVLAVFGTPLAILAVYAIAGFAAGHSGAAVVTSLLFGWLFFLDRGLGAMQMDVPAQLVGVVAWLLLLGAVHQIGRRWTASWTTAGTSRRWTWRSTVATTIGVCLLFGAGVAVVGGTHQLMWLATGRRQASVSSDAANWSRESGGPFSLISQVRQAAWRTESRNNLRQFSLAMLNYHDNYSQFPPGAILLPDGRGYRGWVPPLGPFISFSDEWSFSGKGQPWDGPDVAAYGKGAMPFLVHPDLGWHGQFDQRGFALMHYAGNVHMFPNNRGMRIDEITDGSSTTLAIGEVAENFQPWASPYNRRDPADGINDVPWGFGGPPWQHGAQFALADGSVRFLSKNIDRKVLRALGTPAGNDDRDLAGWER
jgi:hypothetical protein